MIYESRLRECARWLFFLIQLQKFVVAKKKKFQCCQNRWEGYTTSGQEVVGLILAPDARSLLVGSVSV